MRASPHGHPSAAAVAPALDEDAMGHFLGHVLPDWTARKAEQDDLPNCS
jgi:hypothetical protein